MKKLLALMMALIMVTLCVPAAHADDYVDPTGIDISDVHAAYLTEGGAASETQFLTKDDFASHTVTVLNVWSSGCGPCLNEMPYFQQFHEMYGGDDVLVVGCVSTWIQGTYSGAWNVLQNKGYTYMNVIQDSVLYNLYSRNNFVPQTFIVNSDGIVVDFIAGGTNFNGLCSVVGGYLASQTDKYFDVDFVDNVTGDVFLTQSVHMGLRPSYPVPPEIEGYTFSNWDPATAPMIMGPTTITAKYTIKTFQVKFFDSLTGDKIKTVYVKYGHAATAPTPPEHEGYEFVGWDKDFSFVTAPMDIYTIYVPEGTSPGVPGDMNGDGIITSSDALVILRYSMGSMELTPAQLELADYNHDGAVNSADALAVLRTTM